MKSVAVAVFPGLLIGIAVIQMVRTDAATSVQEKAIKKASDEYLGPIVDYDRDFQTAALANPKERALREVRGRRYNRSAPIALGEMPPNLVGYATGTDWYVGVPALPLAESDTVIVGDVAASEAHISNDRTGVYSEFSIRITEVHKNQLDAPLSVGDVTVGEREGGVVRFQDGRLFEFTVFHQGMPRPDRRYLFFMSRNKEGEDYTIVTAYELRQGQVFPLDDSLAFASFQGTNQQDFLNKVRREIALRR